MINSDTVFYKLHSIADQIPTYSCVLFEMWMTFQSKTTNKYYFLDQSLLIGQKEKNANFVRKLLRYLCLNKIDFRARVTAWWTET
jgi:hypothetical protein